MRRPHFLLSGWISFFALAGCGPSGPDLVPVRGRVLVNGQPAAMVRVQFYHQDPAVVGNERTPTGLTDSDGYFQLTTIQQADGARRGRYRIGFEWLSGNSLDAYDRFGGFFTAPEKHDYTAEISGPTELAPFLLTFPETQLKSSPRTGPR
jgi:hypothetical protein